MTQEKMKKIIMACASAATALLVFLGCYLIYQGIYKAVQFKKIEEYEAEKTRIEEQNAKLEEELSFYQSDWGQEILAYQYGYEYKK